MRLLVEFEWTGAHFMAEDWVRQHILTWEARNVQKEAPAFFEGLWKRVDSDLRELEKPGYFHLEWQVNAPDQFTIRKEHLPAVTAVVKLSSGIITCKYSYNEDSTSGKTEKEQKIIIVSDGHGQVQAKSNGKTFIDHSEVSEFLLMPILEFLRDSA